MTKSAKTILEHVFTLDGTTIPKELMPHRTYLTRDPYVTEAQIYEAMYALRAGLLAAMPDKQHKAHLQPYNSREQKISEYEDRAANNMLDTCIQAISNYFGDIGAATVRKGKK